MQIIVKKFGGTSVGSISKIKNIATEISRHVHTCKQIIVVSAMSGETNRLLALCSEISPTPTLQDQDMVATTGEQVSTGLLSMALNSIGVSAIGLLGWQIPIITENNHANARIHSINGDALRQYLHQHDVVVISGFQGVTENNRLTTLGRGGSDTSAVAIAVAVDAHECQIYTDVDGVYSADPNQFATAHKIDRINSTIMLEMASLGAKVLHVRSCELGFRHNLNISVLSSFDYNKKGTTVSNNYNMEEYPIISLNQSTNQAYITINTSNNIIAKLYGIANLDMLQSQTGSISFACDKADVVLLEAYLTQYNYSYNTIPNLSKISLVGSGFRSNNKLNAQVWNIIHDFPIIATTYNEISISFLVENINSAVLCNKLAVLLDK